MTMDHVGARDPQTVLPVSNDQTPHNRIEDRHALDSRRESRPMTDTASTGVVFPELHRKPVPTHEGQPNVAEAVMSNIKQPVDTSVSKTMDLSNTQDVDETVRYATAVTHEEIRPVVHNIREEHVTREVHTYDVYHRILPVVDVQVLPAKHFVRDPETGKLVEIAESQVPALTASDISK